MRIHLFRMLGIIHLILGVVYLYWRTTQGFYGSTLWLSVVFFAAESFTFLTAIAFFLSQFAPPHPPGIPFDRLATALGEVPYIDVLVIRRWDSIETTSQTAKAALQMNYPWHRLFVHIVDLETDEGMRLAANSIPCEYFSCFPATIDPWQYYLDAVTTFGEFLLILEPGQFPEPDLLQKTLPCFYDCSAPQPVINSTGYVQVMLRTLGHATPDHPLQQPIPLGQTGGEATPLLGTGALIRRQALRTVSYLDSRHPVLLGCLMHQQGWKSYLCASTQIASVLLPLRNRLNALMAVLEALKSNPILQGQTSQAQRLQYLWLSFWSTSGMASLIYFIIPIVFLWTGMTPVPSFDPTFFTWFLPYLVVGWLSRIAAFPADQRRHAWRAERQKEAQFFQSIQAVIQFLKGIVPYRETATQLSVGPQAVLFLLTLSSMIAGTLRFWQGGSVSGYALTFGLLWAMYNLALLSISPPGVDFSFLRQEQDPTQSDPVEAGQ